MRSQPPMLLGPRRGPLHPEQGGVSMVFPVHNESFVIEQTLRHYIAELGARIEPLEVIVAEDGSSDETVPVLERLAAELPIRLFTHRTRKGYQRAVIDAVAHATQPWVFIVDSDYQFAPYDFWRLEPLRAEADVILGVKTPRRDPMYRRFLAAGYNLLLRWLFHVSYRDMDTGFRLARREALLALAPRIRHMSFFTAEFVLRADHAGYRIRQVAVSHYARKIGSTSIFYVSSLLLICIRQFVGMLKLRWELRA